MGKQGQTVVTKENLLQWIENYRWMVETIEEARQPVSNPDKNSSLERKRLCMVLRQLYQRQVVAQAIQCIQKYNVH
ncbi:hypothetical protein [Lysinibacillus fusiformis]|uniref:hypothetical protein n=1 Tax=Lysinibacillus fusiformis TaxID=28031 RepID=UPI002E1BCA90|nr:hypothetical protein [Lysinibacillus fusiformis]